MDCPTINKYGNVDLSSDSPPSQTAVTMTNTGNVAAHLFLLPSACDDQSGTGAGGGLCDLVSVEVSCTDGGSISEPTLNDFFANEHYPTGYPMGELAAGASTECTFTLTLAGSVPPPGGEISQELSWKLTALP